MSLQEDALEALALTIFVLFIFVCALFLTPNDGSPDCCTCVGQCCQFCYCCDCCEDLEECCSEYSLRAKESTFAVESQLDQVGRDFFELPEPATIE
jgi:hypothetical protein